MIVKCIKINGYSNKKDEPIDNWLTVGKTYFVLEIFRGESDGILKYRIANDDSLSPCLNDASQFEIVSHALPENWKFNYLPEKYIEISPREWSDDNFWPAYFDGERWAVDLYEKTLKEMLQKEESGEN